MRVLHACPSRRHCTVPPHSSSKSCLLRFILLVKKKSARAAGGGGAVDSGATRRRSSGTGRRRRRGRRRLSWSAKGRSTSRCTAGSVRLLETTTRPAELRERDRHSETSRKAIAAHTMQRYTCPGRIANRHGYWPQQRNSEINTPPSTPRSLAREYETHPPGWFETASRTRRARTFRGSLVCRSQIGHPLNACGAGWL